MELKLCANHDGRQVYAKNLCKSCYFKQHDAGRDYKKAFCRAGHRYEDGSYKLSTSGKRICLICIQIKRRTECAEGHTFDEANTYYVNGTPQCKACRNQRMRDRRPATGIGAGGLNKVKTHCPKGHPYDEANTSISKRGARFCRTCARANGQVQWLRNYGITLEKVTELQEAQENKCAICPRVFDSPRIMHIDHDHDCCDGNFSCGECVRGLLCENCNRGLGMFKDNIDLLWAAIEYLDSFKKLSLQHGQDGQSAEAA